ncbi:TIGR02186 family protein [Geminicoccus harenae]|uniref:TIGR02186 family protein n=2 Tax=Geminicoccus harenae TaxID=2498453 RepID=UPI002AC36D0B|nr:TIGR02186 family protein [Geminicoccus harenae]
MSRAARAGLVVVLVLLAGGLAARAAGLVADLSHHLIAITTAFTGSDVLLFGALEETGGDVVVVVTGPRTNRTVRQRERMAGVWLPGDEMTFTGVPSFYAVAATRPIESFTTPPLRARHEMGVEALRLSPVAAFDPHRIARFREALIVLQQRNALYPIATGEVSMLGDRLFRTTLAFPANVASGPYQVQVLRVVANQVVEAQASILTVSKVGLEADLTDFAQRHGLWYGLATLVLAITAGWLANIAFRRS